MTTAAIREALQGAIGFLSENPDEAKATDSYATATIADGLVCTVRGPDAAEVRTRIKLGGEGASEEKLRGIATWAEAHCPVTELTRRAVPMDLAIEVV